MPPENTQINVLVYPKSTHWQHLFSYTPSQARVAIAEYFSNPHRLQLSNSQWALISHTQEGLGHNKWSYAHLLMQRKKAAAERMRRWQCLFNYTASEAQMAMQKHLDNPNRLSISDEPWAAVEREQEEGGYDKEEVGHDRETYIYALMQGDKNAITTRLRYESRKLNAGPRYLFKLEEPLPTREAVQDLAVLSTPPAIISGGESSEFVLLDTLACEAIAAYLAPSEGTFYA
jgi:hypothetical protein